MKHFTVVHRLRFIETKLFLTTYYPRRGSRGGEMGEFSPPFFLSPHLFLDLKHLNQALVLLHYYKNSPPISKSWIRLCTHVNKAGRVNKKMLQILVLQEWMWREGAGEAITFRILRYVIKNLKLVESYLRLITTSSVMDSE